MKKIFIKNRKEQKVVVLVEETTNAKGLAFVMHGLSGNKEQPHIVTMAEAFKENGYTVVRFDTTNTFGESDGKYEDATVTNYYEDLEDVINWSKTQKWYQEPFILAGSSLGGISVILYAQKYPQKNKGLAPCQTVISGKLSLETPKYLGKMESWKKTGWFEEKSSTSPTGFKKLPYSHMIDRLHYDLLPKANKLRMPVLMVVGDKDNSTPYEHQKILFDKLPGKKELHLVKGAPHTFKETKHLEELKTIFIKWIENLN